MAGRSVRGRVGGSGADGIGVASPWLDSLPPRLRKAVLAALQRRRYRAGEALYAQGEPVAGLYGIVAGTVQTIGLSREGQPTLLSVVRPGDWTGFLGILDPSPAVFSTIAVEDVEAVLLPVGEAERIFGGDCEGLAALAAPLVQILRFAFTYLIETNNRSPDRVVAQRLLDLSRCAYLPGERAGGSVERLSQEGVAAASYLARPTVNRVLQGLEQAGLIAIGYGRITILDAAGLEAAAGPLQSRQRPGVPAPATDAARVDFHAGARPGKEAVSLLVGQGWLPSLPPSLRRAVIDATICHRCKRRQIIFERGDAPLGLVAVASGQCRSTARARDGQPFLFSFLYPGAWTGFAAALDGGPQPFTLEVATGGTVALLPMDAVRRIFFSSPDQLRHLLTPMLRMLREIYRFLIEENFGPPPRLLARRLYDLARLPYVAGDLPRAFLESLTQADLSAATGLSRPTVAKLLAELEAAGIVKRSYGRLHIIDGTRLLATASGMRA